MSVFCTECGKENDKESGFCVNCGKPLHTQAETTEEEPAAAKVTKTQPTKPPKKKMSKAMKILIVIIGVLVIAAIGFYIWGNSYQSSDAIQKEYDEAIEEKDAGKLKKIIQYRDGSSISEKEANAYLALLEDEGYYDVDKYYRVVEADKFLGIFKAYTIITVEQTAFYDDVLEGLTFTFDGEEYPVNEEEERMVYGPLIPGLYTVTATYEQGDSDVSFEDEIKLNDTRGGENSINMELPISEVLVQVDNYNISKFNSYVLYNDEKYPIEENGVTEPFGPVITDGSQEAVIVTEATWGDVESDPVVIDGVRVNADLKLMTKEQFEEVLDTLTVFGDEYTEAVANFTSDEITVVTDDYRKEMDEMFENDNNFQGEFISAKVNKNNLRVIEVKDIARLKVKTTYLLEAARYEAGDKPEVEDEQRDWEFSLIYDTDDKKWLIVDMEKPFFNISYDISDEDAEVIKGTETVFKSKEDKKEKKDKKDDKEDEEDEEEKDEDEADE